MPDDPVATAAGLPGNYCKVPGCTEPFAYDHRCERHSDDDDPDTAACSRADFHEAMSMRCQECGYQPGPTTTAAKIGDRVTIEGTVISFLSGGKEARVRLDNDMPFSPAVISAAPESLTVIEDA